MCAILDNRSRYAVGPHWRDRIAAGLLVVLFWAPAAARAQVGSEGKGLLTIQVGRGSAPVGGIANDVVGAQRPGNRDELRATAFRFTAGYHFATHFSAEVGVGHLGTMRSSSAYNGTDVLDAEVSLLEVEGDLVANIPFASSWRVDLSAGIAETGLRTSISTRNGSALPVGQRATNNVRRLGVTVGVDIERRLGDVASLLVGYHYYPRVGSSALRDSASGAATALVCGLRFEF